MLLFEKALQELLHVGDGEGPIKWENEPTRWTLEDESFGYRCGEWVGGRPHWRQGDRKLLK